MFIVIPGNPIPLKRHRTSKGKPYNCQKKEMQSFAWQAKSLMKKDFQIIECPIAIEIDFCMPIPKSENKIRKSNMFSMPHAKKPDLSNLIKFVEDSLEGVIWKDDKTIWAITARKIYSNNPRTIITISDVC